MTLLGGRARSTTMLALDRSLRTVDIDGHMKVEESRISKANICPYLGREIPGYQSLGLDPTRIYKLFRDPEELKKGASSFDGKPVLIRHVPVTAELPRKDLWVGNVGQVTWEEPFLVARPLMLLTKEAIDVVTKNQQRELSAAYFYKPVMEPGTWGGQQYDGRMVDIRGNHVALVSAGRAGPDVYVADELPPELRRMNTRLAAVVATVLAPHLKALSADDKHGLALALDGALGETPAESVISLDAEEMKKCEDEALAEKKKAEGEDAELDDDDKKKAYERARDKKARDKRAKDKRAADAKRAKDKAKDAANAHTSQNMDEEHDDKKGEDEEVDHRKDFDPIKAKDEMNAAIKAAVDAERARSKAAAEAREKVRPLVGVVSMALDSAEEIYKFALKQRNVKHDGVSDAAALGVIVDMAVEQTKQRAQPALAMDSAVAPLADINAIFKAA